MNSTAQNLEMNDSTYVDSAGISEKNQSTAFDLSILSQKLVKYNFLSEMSATRLDNVRCQSVELVTKNRIVNTYTGIQGLKSSCSKVSGECIVACASKGELAVCVVILGGNDEDLKFDNAKRVMNYAFTHFEMYTP